MVGYNLRFHEPVRRLMELVHEGAAGQIMAARLWFGSDLRSWRPGRPLVESYSGRADLGGGVLLDAIHELDLTTWLFGDASFTVAGSVVARVGDLPIDVEDTVRALLRHESGAVVEVALDYLSRRYRRGIEVIGDDATVRLDWSRRVIEIEDEEGVRVERAEADVADSYARQAECFLGWIGGTATPPVLAVDGVRSVELADAIRSAA
jgi:predicted dehydrogenase